MCGNVAYMDKVNVWRRAAISDIDSPIDMMDACVNLVDFYVRGLMDIKEAKRFAELALREIDFELEDEDLLKRDNPEMLDYFRKIQDLLGDPQCW